MSQNERGPFSMKRRHLSQKNFVRPNEPLGEDETIVQRTHEWMLSRFSLSSPAPNKGDFFLTSRFEHRHWTRLLWIVDHKSDWRKVWLKLKTFKLQKLRNMVASEIFSDLHLRSPHEVQRLRTPKILGVPVATQC